MKPSKAPQGFRVKKTKIRPVGGRILVRPDAVADRSAGGILLPDVAREGAQQGTVVCLGTGAVNKDGTPRAFLVKLRDKVLVNKYGGTELEIAGVKLRMMDDDEVIAVVTEE